MVDLDVKISLNEPPPTTTKFSFWGLNDLLEDYHQTLIYNLIKT